VQIAPLTAGLRFDHLESSASLPLRLEPDGLLRLGDAAFSNPAWCQFLLRFAVELHWQAPAQAQADQDTAIVLGSLHLALAYYASMADEQRTEVRDCAPAWLLALLQNAGGFPVQANTLDHLGQALPELSGCWYRLSYRQGSARARQIAATILPLMWPIPLLLTDGGDDRVDVDRQTGRNVYGAAPFPQPGGITFSSCTATTISAPAYAAVEQFRQTAVTQGLSGELDGFLFSSSQQIHTQLLKAFQLPPATHIFSCSSGTCAELLALWLTLAGQKGRKLLNIVAAPCELGSGSLVAASAQHFRTVAPLSACVSSGDTLHGFAAERIRVAEIDARDNNGALIPAQVLQAAIDTEIENAIVRDEHILLHAVDSAKTDIMAPPSTILAKLQKRHSGRLTVLIDAAQMRACNAVLRAYLEHGCMVLITGSKFFTGPPFSGALLVPETCMPPAEALATVPEGLADYITRADLPQQLGQAVSGALSSGPNVGQLMRWIAALWEIEAFQATEAESREASLRQFAQCAADGIAESDWLEPIAPADRSAPVFGVPREWDAQPSIFTFLIRIGPNRYLDFAEARQAHQWLNSDISALLPAQADADQRRLARCACHAGQPVALAHPAQAEVGGLRLAAGARYVTGSLPQPDAGNTQTLRIEQQLAGLKTLISKAALIGRYWAQLIKRETTVS
jgi:hypothetical protein